MVGLLEKIQHRICKRYTKNNYLALDIKDFLTETAQKELICTHFVPEKHAVMYRRRQHTLSLLYHVQILVPMVPRPDTDKSES